MSGRACWWILAAAGVFYSLLIPRFQVGYATDDAYSIVAAQSLGRGHFAVEYQPERPLLTDLLPGYPAVLAPFVKWAAPHWSRLRGLSIFFTLGAGWLLWRLALRPLGVTATAVLLGFFLFNPTTVDLSGSLLSESCFLFFALADLCLFRRLLEEDSPGIAVALGILLAWTALLRPQGVLLPLAMAMVLGVSRKRRSAGILLAIGISLWGTVLVDNWLRVQHLSGYWSLWRANQGGPEMGGILSWTHFRTILEIFFEVNILGMPFHPAAMSLRIIVGALTVGVLLLMGQGWSLWRTGQGPDRPLVSSAMIFGSLYLLIHWLWPVAMPRYFHPLMPLAMTAVIAGAQHVWLRRRNARGLLIGAGCLVAFFYIRQDAAAFQEARYPLPENRIPMETISWIQSRTPTDAVFLAFRIPVLYLYTGRHGYSGLVARDPEAFRYLLLMKRITYVFYEPLAISFVHRARIDTGWTWERSRPWIESSAEGFQSVYRNEKEGAAIFAVRPDPVFIQAYDLYLDALRDLKDRGLTPAGQLKLRQALALKPSFASAQNIYGTSLLIDGHDLNQARHWLQKAVQTQPAFPLAWLNLARVYKRLGRPEQAQACLQKALDSMPIAGEDPMLLMMIRSEMRSR